jgi:DNA repair protein RadC
MYKFDQLSEKELLKLALCEGRGEFVDDLFLKFKDLPSILIDTDPTELTSLKGIGIKKAAQLKAISELAQRLYSPSLNSQSNRINSPKDAADLVMSQMMYLKQEEFRLLILNTKHQVIENVLISIGTLNQSLVHPREVYSPAIKKSAAAVIALHNHPSGDPEPSKEDVSITNRLQECGKILGIELLDHIVIGLNRYVSLKDRGLL